LRTSLTVASASLTAKTEENLAVTAKRKIKRVMLVGGAISCLLVIAHQFIYLPAINHQNQKIFELRQKQKQDYQRQLNYFCEVDRDGWQEKCKSRQRN
jgi:type II secretory pathway component PulM